MDYVDSGQIVIAFISTCIGIYHQNNGVIIPKGNYGVYFDRYISILKMQELSVLGRLPLQSTIKHLAVAFCPCGHQHEMAFGVCERWRISERSDSELSLEMHVTICLHDYTKFICKDKYGRNQTSSGAVGPITPYLSKPINFVVVKTTFLS